MSAIRTPLENTTHFKEEPKQLVEQPLSHESSPGGTGLPIHNQAPEKRHAKRFSRKIHPDGESGRRGFHPLHFFHVCFRSTSTLSRMLNFLWPIVPAAIAVVRNFVV